MEEKVFKYSVDDVITPAAAALGRDLGKDGAKNKFLTEIADFVGPKGRDSDPNRATILSYAVGTTKCSYKFAGMMLDFLHSHRSTIRNSKQLTVARDICYKILLKAQDKRYEHPCRSDSGALSLITEIAGVYILVRRATSDQSMRQELLVLGHDRADSATRRDKTYATKRDKTYATYITPDLVCRGTWAVVDKTVCCMMHGLRGVYSRLDVINLHLLYEAPDAAHSSDVFLSGFLAGITSAGVLPAAVPVVAIKIATANQVAKNNIMQIGHLGDFEIRTEWGAAAKKMSEHIEAIGNVLNGAMPQDEGGAIIIEYTDVTAAILKDHNSSSTSFIDKTITKFCKEFISQKPWETVISRPRS